MTNPPPAANGERGGLLVVDKLAGWTSHDVVARARRVLGTRKVGHAGTLDPAATGVLVLGVGPATRLLGYLSGHDKSYEGTIRLGQTTSTDDAEGERVGEPRDARGIERAVLVAAMSDLTGDIQQVPAAVSAIKVAGQRAYARVRAGESVELAARPVRVARFALLGDLRDVPGTCFREFDFEVDCSAGTYVRALARDLGRVLGVGGHLTRLRRTRSGCFTLADARDVTLESAGRGNLTPVSTTALMGLDEALRRAFPVVKVDAATAGQIAHGQRCVIAPPAAGASEATAVQDGSGRMLALVSIRPGLPAKYLVVFPSG